MPGMNVTQFAKHIGVSEAVMRRAIKRGRIFKDDDGTIDAEAQTVRWHETRDRAMARPAGRPATVSTPSASKAAAKSFDKLKTEKVSLEVQLLQEELRKVKADTIAKDDVRRALAAFARLQSTKWTNFPNRFGLEIAAELGVDTKLTMVVLDRIIRLQLDEIASLKPTIPE